ncbi:MAG: hypothetical protein QOF84_5656 [Streptomyces sp.]|nr:hypothetical protein [Streptomyces sp.]
MTRHAGRVRGALAALATLGTLIAGTGTAGAAEAPALRYDSAAKRLAQGVQYREFSYDASHGRAHGHLLTVDLRDPRVSVDLLTPGAVAARAPVSQLADARGAVGGVNADFFNISETQHPGVDATGAAVGPEISSGKQLKAAVPNGQRFGPSLPAGTTTEDVLGVGTDRTARLDRLTLSGTVRSALGDLKLRGFNQYAIPVDGVGAYTPAWGTASRVRATCGTDAVRAAPCSDDTYEVTVRHERVTGVAGSPGRGAIASGSVVLVGREAGADALRKLEVGDQVSVSRRLVAARHSGYRFAVGGFPVLRGGSPPAGLDNGTAATRTAAGFGNAGGVLYLLALDGNAETGAGLTIRELASLMSDIGATSAVNLDGGGSSTLVSRDPGASHVTVRNHPSGGAERAVPNAIGVFSRR